MNTRNKMWEKIHMKDCSFKPSLNVSSPSKEERKKVLERLLEPKNIPEPTIPKHCTFKPRLNIHFKK